MAKYRVYRNLHTGTFSLQHKGLVIGHPKTIMLEDVDLVVLEKGRQKVLREKRKNVHATLRASKYSEVDDVEYLLKYAKEIYYNPYTTSSFMMGLVPVREAGRVLCHNNKMYIV